MIVVDDTSFPLIHVAFRGDLREHEMDGYIASLDRLLERARVERVRVAIVFDARQVGEVPLGVRLRQTAWLHQHRELCRRHAAGFAFVLQSPFLRGLLTALSWMCPLPAQHAVAEHVHGAEAWCRERLRMASESEAARSRLVPSA